MICSFAVAVALVVAGGADAVAAGGGTPFTAGMVADEVQHAAGGVAGPQRDPVQAGQEPDGLGRDRRQRPPGGGGASARRRVQVAAVVDELGPGGGLRGGAVDL